MEQQALNDCSWTEQNEDLSIGGGQKAARPANSNADWEERRAKLARTIETEVIPRLMITAQGRPARASISAIVGGGPTAADVDAFAKIILTSNLSEAAAFIEQMRDRGLSVEMICVDLMAPAARRLGDYWIADTCSFIDVTLGLGRLQHLLHTLSPATPQVGRRARVRRALLMPTPGEQHTFGLLIVAEFFLRAGWDVWGGPLAAKIDPIAMVRDEWFDVVGLSASADKLIGALARQISEMRKASLNQNLAVMVGGKLFADRPELAQEVGADISTIDGRDAPRLADALINRITAEA